MCMLTLISEKSKLIMLITKLGSCIRKQKCNTHTLSKTSGSIGGIYQRRNKLK